MVCQVSRGSSSSARLKLPFISLHFFPVFTAQVSSINSSSITYSHLHFATIYILHRHTQHEVQNQQYMITLLLKLSLHLPTHTICCHYQLFLSLLSSDLAFSFCKMLQDCWHSRLFIMKSEVFACFQYCDMKQGGNFNNNGM